MQGKSYRLHARARQKAEGRISDTTFTRVAGFQPFSSGRFSLFGDKGGGLMYNGACRVTSLVSC